MNSQFDIPSSNDIDDVDRKIIAALHQDGRMSFSQIARQLKVSPGKIRIRYNRLVELGYLKIVSITNPLNIGYNALAMIGVRAEGSKLLQVGKTIAEMDEVVYLIITTGRFDILLEVMCLDQADLLRFVTEKLHKIEGVKESETFMNMKILKEIYI
jgi:Lrp/AsnC family transcriptional regulator, regulator for asnA, asnC and gidA